MQSSDKNCYIFFVRHGEREDEIAQPKEHKIEFPFDPSLTQKGKLQSQSAGLLIRKFLQEKGVQDLPIQVISSPFLRTLQTASYLISALKQQSDLEILTYDNICVKLKNKYNKDPLIKGALATIERNKFINKYLDNKVKLIKKDEKCQLKRPSFPEEKSGLRYKKGFLDIIQNYFVNSDLKD